MATEQACSMAVLAIGLYWAQLTCAGTCRHVQVRAALHREMAVGGKLHLPGDWHSAGGARHSDAERGAAQVHRGLGREAREVAPGALP